LVSALEAFRHYHETEAQLWERQALVKFRFVAGNRALGAKAESVAQDAAYAKPLLPEEIGEIDYLRMRMEKELAGESEAQFDLKTGMGGIVDIEFLTQMLQLSHGWREPDVRKQGTLEALAALRRRRILNTRDYRLLSEGYLFLRRLDHRLRLERDQSIHVLFREPERLEGVARALGYRKRRGKEAGLLLLKDYERCRERIRLCYRRFFSYDATNRRPTR
jgi:glutamate-ammonia-ligase adenylyltransferase